MSRHLSRLSLSAYCSLALLLSLLIWIQVLEHGTYSQAADVYSLAIVLWEVMTAAPPPEAAPAAPPYSSAAPPLPDAIRGAPFAEFFRLGEAVARQRIIAGARPPLPAAPAAGVPAEVSSRVNELMAAAWSADRFIRPKIAEVRRKYKSKAPRQYC